MEYIERHPEKPWIWYGVSRNPNITMEFIESHPEKTWNWEGVSMNPNLTKEFVQSQYHRNWDWMYMSNNTFEINWKRVLSQERIELIHDIVDKGYIPPDYSDIPVFKRGGRLFWEHFLEVLNAS